MNGYWLLLILAALGWAIYRAGRIWRDARQRGFGLAQRWRWAGVGVLAPSRYWWEARIEAMPPEEQAELLARETAALGLSRADSVRCPLCRAEIPHAWTLVQGRPAVAPGAKCSQCDFRLDTCRHCTHFLPGPARTGGYYLGDDDVTFGRCGFYRAPQPVEAVCPPDVAKRMKAQGYEEVRSPMPIVDSFVPPDFCNTFALHRKRIEASQIRWPDARHIALLRLLARPVPALPLQDKH